MVLQKQFWSEREHETASLPRHVTDTHQRWHHSQPASQLTIAGPAHQQQKRPALLCTGRNWTDFTMQLILLHTTNTTQFNYHISQLIINPHHKLALKPPLLTAGNTRTHKCFKRGQEWDEGTYKSHLLIGVFCAWYLYLVRWYLGTTELFILSNVLWCLQIKILKL